MFFFDVDQCQNKMEQGTNDNDLHPEGVGSYFKLNNCLTVKCPTSISANHQSLRTSAAQFHRWSMYTLSQKAF